MNDIYQIYQKCGVPPTPYTAEEALELLNDLKSNEELRNLPPQALRQIGLNGIKAIIKQIPGATYETIVSDAQFKLKCLAEYRENHDQKTTEQVNSEKAAIKELEAQIEECRRKIEIAKQEQGQLNQLCSGHSNHLIEVVEFIGSDIQRS
jgi:hypothetical protein